MKTLISILAVIMMGAAPALAQDYETRLFQGNTLCAMVVTVTAGQVSETLRVFLQWHETVLQSGELNSGESFEMRLPMEADWYTVSVVRDPSNTAYEITSGLDCGQSETGAPEPAQADMVTLRETLKRLPDTIRSFLFD